MYLVDTDLDISWILPATTSPPLLADLDVSIQTPDKIKNYIQQAIASENYIPATDNSEGIVSYTLNVGKEGLWVISLLIGEPDTAKKILTHRIFVGKNDTTKFRSEITI